MGHAQERAMERYGRPFNFAELISRIRQGKATLVSFGHQGRLFYDVPLRRGKVVRVLVDAGKKSVISIVPPQSLHEKFKAKIKNECDAEAVRNRAYHRGHHRDHDEDVTMSQRNEE